MAQLTTTPPLVAGRWALDPDRSTIGFTVRQLGVFKVRGRLTAVDVDFVVGPTPEATKVTTTVGLASLDTGNARRDAHVLSADLLDVGARPTMTFTSTRIQGTGSGWTLWTLYGDLAVGDVVRPMSFDVELGGIESSFDGTRRARFAARGDLHRKDLGLGFGPKGVIGDVVKVELDLLFVEPSPGLT